MIEGPLVAKKVHPDPPGYRVLFDDGTGPIEIGSISEHVRHVEPRDTYWHWGVDTMPLARGAPSGDAWSFEAAREAFREGFFRWVNELHPGDWQRNRDHIRIRSQPRQ